MLVHNTLNENEQVIYRVYDPYISTQKNHSQNQQARDFSSLINADT